MNCRELKEALNGMPDDAEVLLFTDYGLESEGCHEVKGVRLLEEDPDNVDLIEIQY
jgi:hypothetical protein